jgi:hypothetical protein
VTGLVVEGVGFEIVHKSGCTGLEFVIVRVSICDVSLLVGLFYRAPNVPFASFMTFLEQAVSNIAGSGEVLLMGDFNVDPVNSASHFDLLERMLRSYNLSLVESGPTRITSSTSTTLDRFIVSTVCILWCCEPKCS